MAAANVRFVPSSLHETLIEMFRHRPSLAAELLAGALGLDVPDHLRARVDTGDLSDLSPTEYRADAVVVLSDASAPVMAVVVEVQLRRDADKRWSWPVYLTTLRARMRCPTVVLVVCVDDATARWCAAPIELGHPGATIVPLVLGPGSVPVVTDAADAGRQPELAVLSAMAHGPRADRTAVLDALISGLEGVDQEHATLYAAIVLAALPEAARHHLEALMRSPTFEYQSDFVRKFVFQGRAEGKIEDLLAILAARDIDVPDAARARIAGCTDNPQLTLWVVRAATATSIDDVFSG